MAVLATSWPVFGVRLEDQKKISQLEGEYQIFLSGRVIGSEKYVIYEAGDIITSNGSLEFRSPGKDNQKVSVETKLDMDAQFRPRRYELKSEVDGKSGTIRGEFSPDQVLFVYSGGGVSTRSGLLVGEQYTILDTNAFHHFIFLCRLFKYGMPAMPQTFEVVIPQEKETGKVTIIEIGKEEVLLSGKTMSLTHLAIDSGMVRIQIWVDEEHLPVKIALPEKGIEVVRK
jgi:hypothetical protein